METKNVFLGFVVLFLLVSSGQEGVDNDLRADISSNEDNRGDSEDFRESSDRRTNEGRDSPVTQRNESFSNQRNDRPDRIQRNFDTERDSTTFPRSDKNCETTSYSYQDRNIMIINIERICDDTSHRQPRAEPPIHYALCDELNVTREWNCSEWVASHLDLDGDGIDESDLDAYCDSLPDSDTLLFKDYCRNLIIDEWANLDADGKITRCDELIEQDYYENLTDYCLAYTQEDNSTVNN